MNGTIPTISISPRIGVLLSQVAETPDLEMALWKVLSEYIEMKISFLEEDIKKFEKNWGMTFKEFSEKYEKGTLDNDSYDYGVESEFWEWEKIETLIDHYKSLQSRWT